MPLMSKKVLIAISTNGPGGAERAASYLANYFASEGYIVFFVNSDANSCFYNLDNRVKIIKLDCDNKGKIKNNLRLFARIRSLIKKTKPDFCIPFLIKMELPVILSCVRYRIPFFTSVRNDPSQYDLFTRLFRKIYFKKANGVIFQSKKAMAHKDFSSLERKTVISNMIGPQYSSFINYSIGSKRSRRIFTVGRLCKQKNQALLIDAFEKIADSISDFQLHIYGTGDLKEYLENKIIKDGYQNTIFLDGNVNDAIILNSDASLFVLPSNFEGFPNVLVEAMSCGIPVISTNFPSGVAEEIIIDGINGKLVPTQDIDALSKAMLFMINNPENADIMAKNALKVKEDLSVNKICSQWKFFIETQLGEKNV